jgi:plasmid segregation protein ParM
MENPMSAKKPVTTNAASIPKVGVDDGHDSIKTCAGYSEKEKAYLCTRLPSRAAMGIHQLTSFGDGSSVAAYETEAASFTVVGEQALLKSMDTRSLDYPVSDMNRVLVAHGLIKAGFSGQELEIVTGLPVDQYYRPDGEKNVSLIVKKGESLLKPVKAVGKGAPAATVVRHQCISEGIAAFYDALLDEKGNTNPELEKLVSRRPIGFMDLGGKTLDQGVIMEGAAGIYNTRSGTANIGVLALYDQITSAIKAKLKLNNDPPQSYVAEAFRTKTYELFGEEVDVSDLIESCCRQYVEQIKSEFIKKAGNGDGSDLGAVIFVGGGAALLREVFGEGIFKEIFKGKVIVPEHPEFANARGMWKFAQFIPQQEQEVSIETTAA